MPPDERRDALVRATLPLLRQHGRAVTTRQIAAAAGVAEGTIFGVFESKDQLVDEAITKAFEPGTFVHQHDALDASLPFRERMVALVALLQRRFLETFDLMRAVGMVAPPHREHGSAELEKYRREITERMVALVGEDAAAPAGAAGGVRARPAPADLLRQPPRDRRRPTAHSGRDRRDRARRRPHRER